MNKSAIRSFAVGARTELIEKVTQKALQYGVTKDNIVDPAAEIIHGNILSASEIKQRQALIKEVERKGFEQVIEEVAYTWFNRFIALRFMEVNEYLPTYTRVFSNENNQFRPDILRDALDIDLAGLNKEKVIDYKENNDEEGLYKYLLILQCNALNQILPIMFQKLEDYTALLLPDNLLRTGSILDKLVTEIPAEDWNDQVQIIGWLYQFYNTELKDDVFAKLKKNVKITKDTIAPATQLFTPDWIVRYMVENSLGRLWLEGHPNEALESSWRYYLTEAEQEESVVQELEKIRETYKTMKPEDIRCIDPCMGSGHILCYLFDVLIQIYESYGISNRDAVASILKNNLWGLDIDHRAAQLAYFAVMMKARQYDRRIFTRNIQPHVYSIVESNYVDQGTLDHFVDGDEILRDSMNTIIATFHDAKEYGSLISVPEVDFESLYLRFEEITKEANMSLYADAVMGTLLPLVQVAEVLAQKYDVVVTNPPYMGNSGMGTKLTKFVKENYPDSKTDLFAVFMERLEVMTSKLGYVSMVTMQSWMFLSSFEAMRKKFISNLTVTNLMHMENMVMGIAFGTAVTVAKNVSMSKYKGIFNQVKLSDISNDIPVEFPNYKNRYAVTNAENFSKIPGSPIAYWASESILKAFEQGTPMSEVLNVRQGLATANNDLFLREWWEVDYNKCKFDARDAGDLLESKKKWVPYNKGGARRQWYGNYDYLVNWEHDGLDIKNFKFPNGKQRSVVRNPDTYFKEAITWGLITSGGFSIRYRESGGIHDVSGMSGFTDNVDKLYYLLGILSSKISDYIFKMLNPTVNLQVGDFKNFPVVMADDTIQEKVKYLVKQCIELSVLDWDFKEVSWNFKNIDFLKNKTLQDSFLYMKSEVNDRFSQLQKNEELLNHIFINVYGLEKEFTPDVPDKDITITRIYDTKEDIPEEMKNNNYVLTKMDLVKSLISYAVGCMLGRYSLDHEGLIYAGGEWDSSKYTTFIPDADGILPICDDEYFTDDIVGQFIHFIEVAYGAEYLEENLQFIAEALGGRGTSREVIRNYFLKDFFADHCKMYQKRPIYWLFDSGKNNGFKCLIYLHRYRPDTVARVRTDYVHEQQSRYRMMLEHLDKQIEETSGSVQTQLKKKKEKMLKQDAEVRAYEEKIHHLADQMIDIDLDDGVKVNHAKFSDVLAKIK